MTLQVKRVYTSPCRDDGYRVLVDRLWPRGLSVESAHVDLWLRRVAPTAELRRWYGHDIAKWSQFRQRYREELTKHVELLALIRDIERHRKTVTLLFGAKDEEHNEASVLDEVLRERRRP